MYLDNLKTDIEEKRLREERATVSKEKEKKENLVHEKAKNDKFNDVFGAFYQFIEDLKKHKVDIFSFILFHFQLFSLVLLDAFLLLFLFLVLLLSLL